MAKFITKIGVFRLAPALATMLLGCVLAFSATAQSSAIAVVHVMRNDHRVTELNVEVADTLQEKLQGLMFRESLPERHGMLFTYNPPEHARMWMKNTLIPLDILFIDPEQNIIYIHHNAEPKSLTPIGPDALTASVIEINGGEAKAADIRVGDHILIERKPAKSEPTS